MAGILKEFVESGAVEPWPDQTYGPGYRCSVELGDGTFLPCVMIRDREPLINLVQRRLDEERTGRGVFREYPSPYREAIATFVAKGNRLNDYDVKRVFPSRFAIPMDLLRKIHGETVMSWTGFVLEMNDGRHFAFGTTFHMPFFDLPPDYGFDRVRSVINHSYINLDGEVRSIHAERSVWAKTLSQCAIFREKPFFECYV